MGEFTSTERDALLKKLNEKRIIDEDDTACFGWNGAPCIRGFGRISFKNKAMPAHRAAWIVEHGVIETGNYIQHSCNNKLCTNPKHLSLSMIKVPRDKTSKTYKKRPYRGRISVDLPEKYADAIRHFAKKRDMTITKYLCILIHRVIEIEESYETNR